jgi:branched-chain amino acid transport system ATP-binding protein
MIAALVIEDIHTYYGESYVLQGISLSVEAGRVATILGRNGVGKTTLIRSVMAFTPPRRGQVRLLGEDVTGWPAHRIARHGVALVPQGRRIFASLTVREHLEIAARPGKWNAESLFDVFPRLRERASNRAATLSGGERQMLALARALISNPQLLLMDEPTEGLSLIVVEELGALTRRLKAMGVTILLIEQNLEFALSLADEAYVMDKGRIVHRSSAASLLQNDDVKRTYLGV